MYENIIDFILDVPSRLGQFSTWLFQPLPYIDIPPLMIFSITGVGILLTFHLIRLVVGG